MSDWIPLLQSLVWPAFLAVLLLYGRAQVKTIMEQIAARIKAGASLQVGPSGLSLGQTENKLTRLEETTVADPDPIGDASEPNPLERDPSDDYVPPEPLPDPGLSADYDEEEQEEEYGKFDVPSYLIDSEEAITQYAKVTYLVHTVSAPQIDTDGVERRAIRVIVDADSSQILNDIERVVYHLHPTFRNPNREITDRHNNFALATRAWGEFNLWADVYFRNYEKPLTLFRYLNF